MFRITSIQDVNAVLSGHHHPLAQKWLSNDLIKKTIAVSYDYWVEDTNFPMTLDEFVSQYLDHAEYLGEMFADD
ncbi:hypothetical protein P9D43_17765 [Neobacillus niacini]|uniref:hypothetical protein n=1 Tax=Neobacillus niacini TaxID=86668 RepID=UPI00052FA855|nr:hypothetical protein [Neobacillus niacini]KGM46316.1 hypothetical protein NP83_01015 [Neobacillus niacini]MEC1523849.1 hypothetical protein [Neobacillus niacini]